MLTAKAFAKINWTLAVLDRRADGYHEIQSLMHKIDLCDAMVFSEHSELVVESALSIPQEQNLVYRAASALKQATDYPGGARIRLKKSVPSGAGLGGGSGDAAATLSALNDLWGLGLSLRQLSEVGVMLGSDVPFFFAPAAARVEGRGEIVTPLDIAQCSTLLLVYPGFGVSTAWAYSALAKKRAEHLTKGSDNLDNIQLLCNVLDKKDFSEVQPLLRNDLQDVVMEHYPVIRTIRDRLLDGGASAACMSGSGSTVFGLFADAETASQYVGTFPGCWTRIVRTLAAEDGSL
ncbi:MAG TPA: 4-(cytidine 5'-diphospho)-2-C-methyl-D-erythritol kinase [Dissulfurispiraceae bacterium]|nr:4-(cytidine 5'-diphospho)-2-C-methyl-D-erythritol kinase [Dissulfurispiraceae bacterium]